MPRTHDLQHARHWPATITVSSGDEPLLPNCRVANTILTRMRGLLFHPPTVAAAGMLFIPCDAIHTIGMAYAIDVAFLDKAGCIISLHERVRPGKLMLAKFGARAVLELACGGAEKLQLKTGHQLTFSA